MLSKAVNGFTSAAVDNALRGFAKPPTYRCRAELLDSDLNKLFDLSGLVLDGEISYNVEQPLQGGATLKFIETSRSLASFSLLITTQSRLFHHRLGEATGATVAADYTSNGRTGLYQGTNTFGVASLGLGDTANNSVTFGSAGYEYIPSAAWMNVTAITLALAIKTTGISEALMDRNNGTTNFWRLDTDSSGKLQFQINFTTGSPTTKTFATGVAINDGAAHLIHATYDNAYVRIYIDGRRVLSTAETRAMKSSGTCDLGIGITAAGTEKSFGTFDEVGMAGRALSAKEIRDEFQAWSAQGNELLFDKDRGDRIRIYRAVAMPSNGTDGTAWAEWARFTGVFTSPKVDHGEVVTTYDITCQDLTRVLSDDTFTSRWTIGAAVNYISGANGVIAIAQSAGFDTSAWSVTATALVTPAAIDFEIGTSKLDAINQLLLFINYRSIRFSGSGTGIIELNALDKDLPLSDTIISNTTSIVAANSVPIEVAQRSSINKINVSNGNPDVSPIQVTATNNKVTSATSVANLISTNELGFQIDAPDQTTAQGIANQLLNDQSARYARRISPELMIYPLFEHRDRIRWTLPQLNIDADFVVWEWREPLNPTALMNVTSLSVVDVV